LPHNGFRTERGADMSWRSNGSRVAPVLLAVTLTAALAFALWWGFLRDSHPDAAGIHVSLDFTGVTDGPPPSRFDTGQIAASSKSPTDPGSNFMVRNGRLTYRPTTNKVSAAYFSTPDMGAPVTSLGASWVFSPGDGTFGAIALLVSRGTQDPMPPIVPPVAVHFVATAVNWNLSVGQNEARPLETVATGDFAEPLKEDNATSYSVSIYLDGEKATINLPDGGKQIVKDPRISEWQGNFATFEVYSNYGLSDSIGGFEQVWADSTGKP
jgi:hypothetical protein